MYFWSNKCSFGEQKKLFSKTIWKSYQPQTFEFWWILDSHTHHISVQTDTNGWWLVDYVLCSVG